jgi:hypothetical protein
LNARCARSVAVHSTYDDSLVPGQIVASVMHLPHVTDREERELGVALRWSTLFPLLGRPPPPWRWQTDVLATSLGTHAAYVTAVAVADDAVRRT